MPITAPPTVDLLPDTPSRTNRSTFSLRMDNHLAAMPTFRLQLIALAANVYANAVEAAANANTAASQAAISAAGASSAAGSATTAATQVALAVAALGNVYAAPGTAGTSATTSAVVNPSMTRTWVTQAGKAWAAGQVVVIQSRSKPDAFMVSQITNYAGSTLSTTTLSTGTAGGTYSDWDIFYLGSAPPLREPGKALRVSDDGYRQEWGDEGGAPRVLRSSQNLCLYSKDYWQTSTWTQEGAGVGAVVTGPFGGASAYPVTANGAGPAYGRIATGGVLPSVSTPYTLWTFIKKGDQDTVNLDFALYGGADANATASMLIDFTGGGCVVNAASAEDGVVECGRLFWGDGWWLVWMSMHPRPSHTHWICYLYGDAFGSTSGTTYYGGTQVEPGRGPGAYNYTTSAPVTGPGAARQNLLLHNMELDTNGPGWTLGPNQTRVGKARSPRGDMTATCYTTTLAGYAYLSQTMTWAANTQYTVSVYARLVSGSLPTTGTLIGVDIDTNNNAGSLERVTLAIPGSGLSSEWKRFWLTFTNVAAVTGNLYFLADFANGAKIAVWGGHVNPGPVPEPLIPNAGSVVNGSHQTALLRRRHLLDSSKGAFAIACDVPLADGDWFEVEDSAGACGSNPVTVMAGPVGRIAGDTADFVIDVPFWSGRFTYSREKGMVIS